MSYDFHTHTTFSDGVLTPDALISLASQRGIKGISVTDHDSISNYSEVKDACKKYNVDLIMGIEISSQHKGKDVHLLGYFAKEEDYLKLNELENHRKVQRINRLKKICENLANVGVIIDADEIINQHPKGTIGRPQIAQKIIEKGYASSLDEVFSKYLSAGMSGYVPSTIEQTLDIIKLVNEHGGISSIAHPGTYFLNNMNALRELISGGLRGIECFYPSHDYQKMKNYLNIANNYKLVATGGSDYHGNPHRPDNLGRVTVPEKEYVTFKQKLEEYSKG